MGFSRQENWSGVPSPSPIQCSARVQTELIVKEPCSLSSSGPCMWSWFFTPSGDDLLAIALMLSCVRLFATPWTVVHQAPLSMGLSWQEYWSGLPFPPPWDIPDPGVKLCLLPWQVDSSPLSHLGSLSPSIMYRKVMFFEHLIYLRYRPKSFTYINLFNPHMSQLHCQRTWSLKEVTNLFKVNQNVNSGTRVKIKPVMPAESKPLLLNCFPQF